MSYIQGFVIAVPTADREAFRAHAAAAAPVFKEHGAAVLLREPAKEERATAA